MHFTFFKKFYWTCDLQFSAPRSRVCTGCYIMDHRSSRGRGGNKKNNSVNTTWSQPRFLTKYSGRWCISTGQKSLLCRTLAGCFSFCLSDTFCTRELKLFPQTLLSCILVDVALIKRLNNRQGSSGIMQQQQHQVWCSETAWRPARHQPIRARRMSCSEQSPLLNSPACCCWVSMMHYYYYYFLPFSFLLTRSAFHYFSHFCVILK